MYIYIYIAHTYVQVHENPLFTFKFMRTHWLKAIYIYGFTYTRSHMHISLCVFLSVQVLGSTMLFLFEFHSEPSQREAIVCRINFLHMYIYACILRCVFSFLKIVNPSHWDVFGRVSTGYDFKSLSLRNIRYLYFLKEAMGISLWCLTFMFRIDIRMTNHF